MREFSPDLRERVKAHKARTRTNRPQRAIVVYPSHAITERTISRLLDALTETGRQNVVQRFVPVRRLRTTHKHMASLLSPQSETLLQQALSREPIKKVIVFDDGLVSGNTNRDLGNLIAQFTNLPIQTVVIVNRRREPGAGAASSITQQYWRLDLPRLGNKQSCLLCRALEDIQTFRATAVTSQRGKARLQNWLDSWRGVDPNREWSGTGLRPLKLAKTIALQVGKTIGSPPAEGDRVQIDWSTALSVFDAELTAMTGLDDHIHRLLAKVTPLDPAVETELLTTHLLLFWNDIPPKIRTGICMRLISLVCRTEVPDLRTSLASLVLCAEGLRQGNVFEDRLLAYLDRDGIILANICFDATILFAYLYSKHILTSTKFYRSVRLLSTPRHSPARAYNDLYFETRGPVGNPHILPLQQLADGQVPPELYQRVRAGALDQLDKLENLLSCLDVRQARPSHALEWHSGDKPPGEATKARGGFELLRSFGVDAFQEKEEEDRYDRRKGKLLKKLGDLRETLINDIGGHYFRTEADIRMRSRGLDVCKEVMRLLSEFRKTFFFLEFSKDELRRGAFESYFIDPLYEYLGWDAAILVKRKEGKTFSKPALVCNQAISGTIPLDLNISIVCDSAVVRTFRDLLLNTGYAQTKEGEECSNASIGTSFLPDRVEITLSNSCSRLAADVIIDADKSYKWAAFQEIGGSVTYRQVGATEVAVVMAVPYAGFCTGE